MAAEDKSERKKGTKKKAKFGEGFGSFSLAVIAILSFRWLLFEPYVIPSGSMIPTLLVHDHILVKKFAYAVRVPFTKNPIVETGAPKRGDIVVFRSLDDDGFFLIKRVVGLPGDTIEQDPDRFLMINGEKLDAKLLPVDSSADSQKPYYPVSEADLNGSYSEFDFFEENLLGVKHREILTKGAPRMFSGPVTVPENHYFVMGDNRDNSSDSRVRGFIPKENLLGKALFVWLSCDETLPFLPFLCNPIKLRWGRFFHNLN